ncbi:uncharacterized protein EV154DRAFT_595122 [Mucor mucedo]|uniref:uncharacterized protein n=1 Tax=Mucor mucedo TaxID=29922 RepID=UPI00221FC356|nr:uncharacterized protein EV154DRAFT_595122 [Mucor mucedo]KAI7887869.1 hypothetical protein EV154DRAFT_595122 [Mucor mucedo]
MNSNHLPQTGVINLRPSNNRSDITCPWCPEDTRQISSTAFAKHVSRKHPNELGSDTYCKFRDWRQTRRASRFSTEDAESISINSPLSFGSNDLMAHYYTVNPNANEDSDDENFDESPPAERENLDMLDNDVYSSDEEDGDNDNSLNDITESYMMNMILPISRNFEQQSEGSPSETAQEDLDRLNYARSHMEQRDHLPDMPNPFISTVEGLLHAFFYGDEDLCSERMVKKILYLLKSLLKLQEASATTLVLPKPDRIYNLHKRLKTKVPVFEPVEHRAKNKKGELKSFFMNPPSEFLKHLAATPNMIKEMSTLPDFTVDRCMDLNHGEKWREHQNFQTPMLTNGNKDFWVGDLIKDTCDGYWLIKKFFSAGETITEEGHSVKRVFAEAVPVICNEFGRSGDMPFLSGANTNFAIVNSTVMLPLNDIVATVPKAPNFQGSGCTVKYNQGRFDLIRYGIDDELSRLWFGTNFANRYKRLVPGSPLNSPKFLKFVVAPIILWSDDTSDKNLQAVDMLGAIVDDLSKLEQGIEVYSYDHQEYVLLVAPLLLFMADNPRHSQLAMHKGTSSKFPCRKCLRPKATNLSDILRSDPDTLEPYILHRYDGRTLAQLKDVIRCQEEDKPRYKTYTDIFSFSVNGSEEFLRLHSFDPTLDSPVEVLYTVPLGCIKYLVDYLIKQILSVAERERLGNAISNGRNNQAYSRTFRNNLRHCGSFVGRDYKQLIQVLPIIMRKVFPNPNTLLKLFTQAFASLGQLCSLIYMRNVDCRFEEYKKMFSNATIVFTNDLYCLDDYLVKNKDNAPMFSLRPKVHMLHHLLDDIKRFGCPLQYETESSEQFNKFIREHLFMTNRLYTSRDVAFRFGKQFICRQKHFFGARENVSDSYYILKSKVVANLSGLFETNSGLMLGQIETDDDGDLILRRYKFARNVAGSSSSWLPGTLSDAEANVFIRPHSTVAVDDSFSCKEVMDISFVFNAAADISVINVSKFGSFWSVVCNHASI